MDGVMSAEIGKQMSAIQVRRALGMGHKTFQEAVENGDIPVWRRDARGHPKFNSVTINEYLAELGKLAAERKAAS